MTKIKALIMLSMIFKASIAFCGDSGICPINRVYRIGAPAAYQYHALVDTGTFINSVGELVYSDTIFCSVCKRKFSKGSKVYKRWLKREKELYGDQWKKYYSFPWL